MNNSFAGRLLKWAEQYGRTGLPWQNRPTPYRVWVSEIMLQQTRVETVIPYFQKFIKRFSSIKALADAPQDEVLHYWSGLGYYARARNLHKAARQIRDRHGGRFPADIEDVLALPGIGRSTAAAILSLSKNQKHTILDGNVKRVLARHQAIAGWPGNAGVEKTLWGIARQLTPNKNNAAYTQAMMDLGATVCTRKNPQCGLCPVNQNCLARNSGRQHQLPDPRPGRAMPTRNTVMLAISSKRAGLLMQRRPGHGLWGGLWSFPEFATEKKALAWCVRTFQREPESQQLLPVIAHTFSHYKLFIRPVAVRYKTPIHWVMEGDDWVWYKHGSSQAGLAAPVNQLIKQLVT